MDVILKAESCIVNLLQTNSTAQIVLIIFLLIALCLDTLIYVTNKHVYWADIVFHYAILVIGCTMIFQLLREILNLHRGYPIADGSIILGLSIIGIVGVKVGHQLLKVRRDTFELYR